MEELLRYLGPQWDCLGGAVDTEPAKMSWKCRTDVACVLVKMKGVFADFKMTHAGN